MWTGTGQTSAGEHKTIAKEKENIGWDAGRNGGEVNGCGYGNADGRREERRRDADGGREVKFVPIVWLRP